MTAPKPPGFGAMRLVGEIAVRGCSPPNRVGLHVSASCLSRLDGEQADVNEAHKPA